MGLKTDGLPNLGHCVSNADEDQLLAFCRCDQNIVILRFQRNDGTAFVEGQAVEERGGLVLSLGACPNQSGMLKSTLSLSLSD